MYVPRYPGRRRASKKVLPPAATNTSPINPISADAFETGQNIPRPEITLESLETYSFSVWYRPDDGEDHSGAINLSSNDPERTSATIPLSAEEYSD